MSDNNPYEAPTANLEAESASSYALTEPRSVPADRGWGWIADGFDFFRRCPGPWILTVIVFVVLMIVISLLPVVGQFAFAVTYFVWTGGLMLGCRAQAKGEDFDVRFLFAGFGVGTGKLVLLSVLMSVASAMLMVAAVGPVYLDIISAGPGGPGTDAIEAMGDPVGFLLRVLVGMLFMIPLAMAFWFAPVLIVINDVPVLEALRLSFIGCMRNVLPFLLYGIIAIVLYILAIIPLLLGLLVFMPVMFASMFVAYRDIFVK